MQPSMPTPCVRKCAASIARWPSIRMAPTTSTPDLGSPPVSDMTDAMLAKSRATPASLGMQHVEFREGLAEAPPVDDDWADVVISNGVINLCADKRAVFAEIHRVLRAGGVLQFADITNGQPVPVVAINNIDLWTA
jgi:ubiquinone/menaquinone biosynthesis C-methylase UbiE